MPEPKASRSLYAKEPVPLPPCIIHIDKFGNVTIVPGTEYEYIALLTSSTRLVTDIMNYIDNLTEIAAENICIKLRDEECYSVPDYTLFKPGNVLICPMRFETAFYSKIDGIPFTGC